MEAQRRRAAAGIALFAALAAPVAAGAAPRGYRGTISIRYFMQADHDSTRTGGMSDGKGTFTGTYHLHGGRYRGKRSYLLLGSGTEHTKVFRSDSFNDTGVTAEFSLSAIADGAVHLVARPNRAREAAGVTLMLRPHGKFKISLVGLDGGTPGVPLSYRVDWKTTRDCTPDPGLDIHTAVYDEGMLEEANPQVCPGSASEPVKRTGKKKQQSLWGANVWDSHARSPRPDLCHEKLALSTNPFICGRVKGGGAIRGRVNIGKASPGWAVPGPCPFEPWGLGGLQDPFEDGISRTCSSGNFDVNGPVWRQILTIDYDLKPVS
jgi:hypothetical protein